MSKTGRITCDREVGPFHLQLIRYIPGVMVPPYEHQDLNVCLLLSGTCVEHREGTTHRYVGPALTINVPSAGHEFVVGPEGAVCFSLDVPRSWVREAEEAGPLEVAPAVNVRAHRPVASALRLREALMGIRDLAPLEVEEGILETLAVTLPGREHSLRGDSTPRWVERIRERMDDDPTRDHGLASLAREAGVHRVHLARSFRRWYGVTVGEHLRRLRLRQAVTAIANGDGEETLSRVALRAGFYDQSHFNRHFKKRMGMTPSGFRRLVRGH